MVLLTHEEVGMLQSRDHSLTRVLWFTINVALSDSVEASYCGKAYCPSKTFPKFQSKKLHSGKEFLLKEML